jgi:transcriptional regulator with XRE-family HTH domain
MEIKEIKQYLKDHGITYKQLSKMCGVPESTLKNIFGGFTEHPRVDTMDAIENALGLNEFPVVPEELKKIPVAFYEGLDGLTDESMQDILEYIQFVKEKQNKK